MKKIYLVLVVILLKFSCYSQQIKVAIVDFENTSGIAKYDGLGKAMSSMLISDIEANVSQKRLQLVERSQINKILKEQNFQKTSSVDKASTVKMGKLLGVKYLLVGDIFILHDALVINSRLVDTETGDIKFAEKQEGKLNGWLQLKTSIAKVVSENLKIPFTKFSNENIDEKALLLYSNSINFIDNNDLNNANLVLNELKYSYPNFLYSHNKLDEFYKKALNQNENIKLRQKAYILNLHNKLSTNPKESWILIENFWNGPMDENYPYLEYLFLIKTYDKYKDSKEWMDYSISRNGYNCALGDIILYSISNHAGYAGEITNAIKYDEIRKNRFPLSELEMINGSSYDKHLLQWAKLDNPNSDTIYYRYFLAAQSAVINGIGLRNEKRMKDDLNILSGLFNLDFYNYIPSEFYYEYENVKIPLFNPYDIIGNLTVLIGDENQKRNWKNFIEKNNDKIIYGKNVKSFSWYNNILENSICLKWQSGFLNSTYVDYINKNWNSDDFSTNNRVVMSDILTKAIALNAQNKYLESMEILDLISDDKYNFEMEESDLNIKNKILKNILVLKNSIHLGLIEKAKWAARQLEINGVEPSSYYNLHTEFFD